MKLWNRLVLGSLVLALALGVCVGPAAAASKKKKTTSDTHTSGTTHAMRHVEKVYLTGTNIYGRSGLLIGDTSDVARVGKVEGSAHFIFQSIPGVTVGTQTVGGGSIIGIPFGGHFGAAENVDLYASGYWSSINFNSVGGFTPPSASTFMINFGGKYRIAAENSKMPDFSVGGDITIPTNGGNVIVTPKGTISYVLESGLLLNGELGIGISSTTYVLADAGVGVPFSSNFTGIAEIGANQMGYNGSALMVGARLGDSSLKFQPLLGLGLNTGSGVILGAGIILASN